MAAVYDGQGNNYGLIKEVAKWVEAGITDIGIPILYQLGSNRFTFFRRVSSKNVIAIAIDEEYRESIYITLRYNTAMEDGKDSLGGYAGWRSFELPLIKDYRAIIHDLKEFILKLDIKGELYI